MQVNISTLGALCTLVLGASKLISAPGGVGKSRIIATTAFFISLFDRNVNLVYTNKYLCDKDKEWFADLFSMSSNSELIHYHEKFPDHV